MSLKIRLARGGTKKRPFYRIIVADSRSPRDGRYIDRVGTYDPMLPKESDKRVSLDAEKAKEWLAKGAQPTDRVLRFLDAAGLMKREARNNPERAVPGTKAKERAEAKAKKSAAGEAPATRRLVLEHICSATRKASRSCCDRQGAWGAWRGQGAQFCRRSG